MKPKAPAEDPAAKAQRERDRRLSELSRLETGMEQADGLTADLREVYGLRRLGRPGATTVTGKQPSATKSVTGLQPKGSFNVMSTQKSSGTTKLMKVPAGNDFGWFLGQMFSRAQRK